MGLDLAYCREQAGDLSGAEQAARDVLHVEPEDPRALNFLGYLLADHNLKLDEAETLIRKAIEQEPDNGAYVDSMGWVHFRLGRFDEARKELEALLGARIYLGLYVKVAPDWRENPQRVRELDWRFQLEGLARDRGDEE